MSLLKIAPPLPYGRGSAPVSGPRALASGNLSGFQQSPSQMGRLSRIGVAIDSDLLKKFDALIARRGYTNRSEAFRDLIRDELVERTWQ